MVNILKTFFIVLTFILFSTGSVFADVNHDECEKKLREAEQRAALAEIKADEAEKRAALAEQKGNQVKPKIEQAPAKETTKKTHKRIGDDGFRL